jgi:hypothetical protein
MPAFGDKYGRRPIESAPLDEDVRLTVSDGRGRDPYRLPYPCRLTRPAGSARARERRSRSRRCSGSLTTSREGSVTGEGGIGGRDLGDGRAGQSSPHPGLHGPAESPYLRGMLPRRIRTDGFIDPCIPSRAPKPPSGPDWVHEIKHDGYRLIVRRHGEAVRPFTRRGYDWTDRYPAIASAAAKLKARSFTLDGEAVVAGADGVGVFDALHRRGRVSDAILRAFDLLELDRAVLVRTIAGLAQGQ